jgi:long-subunit acyl-CoA synthetase (AMP-forming)
MSISIVSFSSKHSESYCSTRLSLLWFLQLKGFEYVKKIYVESSPFDMERDLLTPTYKIKRPKMLKYYQNEIDALYKEIRAEAKN